MVDVGGVLWCFNKFDDDQFLIENKIVILVVIKKILWNPDCIFMKKQTIELFLLAQNKPPQRWKSRGKLKEVWKIRNEICSKKYSFRCLVLIKIDGFYEICFSTIFFFSEIIFYGRKINKWLGNLYDVIILYTWKL